MCEEERPTNSDHWNTQTTLKLPSFRGDDEDEDPSHGYVCMATGRKLHYRVLNSGDSILASISPADIIPGDPWRTENRLLGLGKSDGENSQIGWTHEIGRAD